MNQGTDVIVVGAGAIGLTAALELAQAGASVRLIEKNRCGREASWAGAGMVIPGNLLKAATPEARLRALSFELWPTLSEQLKAETGIDNEFRTCGAIEARFEPGALDDDAQRWREEGVDVSLLDAATLRSLEPAVSSEVQSAYRLPAMSQVRNPRHLRSLQLACESLGIVIQEEAEVAEFVKTGERVTGVRTKDKLYSADQTCVCAGAWTGRLLEGTEFSFPIEPVRGQMVICLLYTSPSPRD